MSFPTPVLTNAGRTLLVGLLQGTGNTPSHMAVGVGDTHALVDIPSLTALLSEYLNGGTPARVALTSHTSQTIGTSNDTYQAMATFTAPSAASLTEMGLLNASTAGTLLLYVELPTINVLTGDMITFTLSVQF